MVCRELSVVTGRIEDMFGADPEALIAETSPSRRHAGDVPHSAAEIAAEIRRRNPGVGIKKLHKLLYYCQGHHLAGVGRPLFTETVSAWDMGPVVGQLWKAEKESAAQAADPTRLGEAELNTVGYVLSRYGRLTAHDLEHLTHGEQPWLQADADRPRGGTATIRPEWMRDYFQAEERGDEDVAVLDGEAVRRFVQGAERRLESPARADSVERLRSRARGHA